MHYGDNLSTFLLLIFSEYLSIFALRYETKKLNVVFEATFTVLLLQHKNVTSRLWLQRVCLHAFCNRGNNSVWAKRL